MELLLNLMSLKQTLEKKLMPVHTAKGFILGLKN